MPNELTSLWTPEQIILTAVILIGCVAMATIRPARPGEPKSPSAGEENAEPPRRTTAGRRARLLLTIVLLAVAAFLVRRGGDPVGVRMDSWSDSNVLVSGRNYARLGLLANYGVAQHQVVTDQNPPDPFFLYTNYPPASNLINGLWRIAAVTSERVYRLLPAACSLLAVLVWFGVFERFAGPAVAVVAAITMATSWGFLAYADNLHFHAYAFLLCALAVRCLVGALAPEARHRRRRLLLMGALVFLMALFTWEYDLWILLFTAAYALLFRCPIRRAWLLLLIVPLVLATALQSAQRRAALAGAGIEAASDGRQTLGFVDHLYRRTIGFDIAEDTPEGLSLRGYPAHEALRFYKFYGVPFAAAVAMILAVLAQGRRAPWRVSQWTAGERLLVALTVASPAWWLTMMQHSSVHPHVLRHALAAYSLLMALVWVRSWRMIRSSGSDAAAQILPAILAVALLYAHADGTICNLRLHWTTDFYDPRQRSDMGHRISREYVPLQQVVPPGAVIFTNGLVAPMRVFAERPVYCATFYPYPPNDRKNARFFIETRFNHLRQLYRDRLPSIYYVYDTGEIDLDKLASGDPLLRLLALGPQYRRPTAASECAAILREAAARGRSDRSFCPIVRMDRQLIVFRMDPLVPTLRQMFDRFGFPSPRQFGPAR
ncbi:MAG: hypothetical protein ACPMAQ_01795 [Phycisphaerae bacterium]